ncbi:MAG: hypothetical protein CMB80_01365 [Flammeovirgaceae bacterium]|nr:hypothetical protein [Flammeovirgaceae bacterium]
MAYEHLLKKAKRIRGRYASKRTDYEELWQAYESALSEEQTARKELTTAEEFKNKWGESALKYITSASDALYGKYKGKVKELTETYFGADYDPKTGADVGGELKAVQDLYYGESGKFSELETEYFGEGGKLSQLENIFYGEEGKFPTAKGKFETALEAKQLEYTGPGGKEELLRGQYYGPEGKIGTLYWPDDQIDVTGGTIHKKYYAKDDLETEVNEGGIFAGLDIKATKEAAPIHEEYMGPDYEKLFAGETAETGGKFGGAKTKMLGSYTKATEKFAKTGSGQRLNALLGRLGIPDVAPEDDPNAWTRPKIMEQEGDIAPALDKYLGQSIATAYRGGGGKQGRSISPARTQWEQAISNTKILRKTVQYGVNTLGGGTKDEVIRAIQQTGGMPSEVTISGSIQHQHTGKHVDVWNVFAQRNDQVWNPAYRYTSEQGEYYLGRAEQYRDKLYRGEVEQQEQDIGYLTGSMMGASGAEIDTSKKGSDSYWKFKGGEPRELEAFDPTELYGDPADFVPEHLKIPEMDRTSVDPPGKYDQFLAPGWDVPSSEYYDPSKPITLREQLRDVEKYSKGMKGMQSDASMRTKSKHLISQSLEKAYKEAPGEEIADQTYKTQWGDYELPTFRGLAFLHGSPATEVWSKEQQEAIYGKDFSEYGDWKTGKQEEYDLRKDKAPVFQQATPTFDDIIGGHVDPNTSQLMSGPNYVTPPDGPANPFSMADVDQEGLDKMASWEKTYAPHLEGRYGAKKQEQMRTFIEEEKRQTQWESEKRKFEKTPIAYGDLASYTGKAGKTWSPTPYGHEEQKEIVYDPWYGYGFTETPDKLKWKDFEHPLKDLYDPGDLPNWARDYESGGEYTWKPGAKPHYQTDDYKEAMAWMEENTGGGYPGMTKILGGGKTYKAYPVGVTPPPEPTMGEEGFDWGTVDAEGMFVIPGRDPTDLQLLKSGQIPEVGYEWSDKGEMVRIPEQWEKVSVSTDYLPGTKAYGERISEYDVAKSQYTQDVSALTDFYETDLRKIGTKLTEWRTTEADKYKGEIEGAQKEYKEKLGLPSTDTEEATGLVKAFETDISKIQQDYTDVIDYPDDPLTDADEGGLKQQYQTAYDKYISEYEGRLGKEATDTEGATGLVSEYKEAYSGVFSDYEKEKGTAYGSYTSDVEGFETGVDYLAKTGQFETALATLTREQHEYFGESYDPYTQTGTLGGAAGKLAEAGGAFTSAKETFDALGSEYAQVQSKIAKYRRLGLLDPVMRSRRYRKPKLGAGSFI